MEACSLLLPSSVFGLGSRHFLFSLKHKENVAWPWAESSPCCASFHSLHYRSVLLCLPALLLHSCFESMQHLHSALRGGKNRAVIHPSNHEPGEGRREGQREEAHGTSLWSISKPGSLTSAVNLYSFQFACQFVL